MPKVNASGKCLVGRREHDPCCVTVVDMGADVCLSMRKSVSGSIAFLMMAWCSGSRTASMVSVRLSKNYRLIEPVVVVRVVTDRVVVQFSSHGVCCSSY